MGPCALCGQIPVDHLSWVLGSAISSRSPNRATELEQLITGRQWREAASIREWEGREDEIEYVALKCPVAGKITLKKMESVFEMRLDDKCLADISLDEADQVEIEVLAAGKWSTATTNEQPAR